MPQDAGISDHNCVAETPLPGPESWQLLSLSLPENGFCVAPAARFFFYGHVVSHLIAGGWLMCLCTALRQGEEVTFVTDLGLGEEGFIMWDVA